MILIRLIRVSCADPEKFSGGGGGVRGIILCSMGGGMMPIFENFNTLI